MALHFQLKVNGQTIETFYARRINPGLPNPDSINSYEYSVTESIEEFTGTIQHRFGDGAWVLVQVILEDIHRQKQERIAYSLEA
jgi:hypothetical protein